MGFWIWEEEGGRGGEEEEEEERLTQVDIASRPQEWRRCSIHNRQNSMRLRYSERGKFGVFGAGHAFHRPTERCRCIAERARGWELQVEPRAMGRRGQWWGGGRGGKGRGGMVVSASLGIVGEFLIESFWIGS